MASPASSASTLGADVYVTRATSGGTLAVSPALADLLIEARNNYAWRGLTGDSQKKIRDLTRDAARTMEMPAPVAIQQLIARIAKWGGGRQDARIARWDADDRARAVAATIGLRRMQDISTWLLELAALPGIGLVIATKVFRFVAPDIGAAGDRHSTYFTNSLSVRCGDGSVELASCFRREWATGAHAASRWAVYGAREAETLEYVERYLPLLKKITASLNAGGRQYTCAARGISVDWTPADVEMAMFFWWAKHGPR